MWLTKSTIEHHLKVAPNEKAVISPIGLSKEEVALVGQDIRFIDESEPTWYCSPCFCDFPVFPVSLADRGSRVH
jgi:hypothetical protein